MRCMKMSFSSCRSEERFHSPSRVFLRARRQKSESYFVNTTVKIWWFTRIFMSRVVLICNHYVSIVLYQIVFLLDTYLSVKRLSPLSDWSMGYIFSIEKQHWHKQAIVRSPIEVLGNFKFIGKTLQRWIKKS
jgi:hypothetical protein